MNKLVYIVMCNMIRNGDWSYHIDSVWTSERKAEKRAKELNADEKKEWREDYGYYMFEVVQEIILK